MLRYSNRSIRCKTQIDAVQDLPDKTNNIEDISNCRYLEMQIRADDSEQEKMPMLIPLLRLIPILMRKKTSKYFDATAALLLEEYVLGLHITVDDAVASEGLETL